MNDSLLIEASVLVICYGLCVEASAICTSLRICWHCDIASLAIRLPFGLFFQPCEGCLRVEFKVRGIASKSGCQIS